MADAKISALTATTTVDDDDLFVIVDAASTTKKIVGSALRTQLERPSDRITGEQTLPRYSCAADFLTPSSGVIYLTFFTALSSASASNAKIICGSAGTGTPTLIRIGLYEVDGSGAGTLVANTANDTALLAGSYTGYTKALASSYGFTRGQRYAAGILQVAATPGKVQGSWVQTQYLGTRPRLVASIGSLSDLPSSFVDGDLSDSEQGQYIAFV